MEHEILGHSRKIIKLSRLKGMPIWHKLREISIEIVIIVFAVSLAAYIERYREHEHEQAEVKEFLLGLRTDLKRDLKEYKEDRNNFAKGHHFFNTVYNMPEGQYISQDTLKKYRFAFYFGSIFSPNDSRFEGFKSAGKIGTIEDAELQNAILLIYQDNIKWLLMITNQRVAEKQKLLDYLMANVQKNQDGTLNYPQLLSTQRSREMSMWVSTCDEYIISIYDALTSKSEYVIERIDEIYGPESESHPSH